MPGGDRTGPNGMGPMTGRRMGHCSGIATPNFTGNVQRGMGRGVYCRNLGKEMGRGYVNNSYPPNDNIPAAYDAKTEKAFLENEVRILSTQLESLKSKLSEFSDKNR